MTAEILPLTLHSRERTVRQHTLSNQRRITFRSRVMNDLLDKARRYARSSASVMITGESGTGKELFSRLIHENSPRIANNYITVNCAAMAETLAESELFGHERGAFTGAFQQRAGHFHHAHAGTLLLDEISEIPISLQAKLLRVIEEQEVQRVGSSTCESIDVRVVATSNRPLMHDVAAGTFRLDLFHRLSVLKLEIPPLRQRLDDLPGLVDYFIGLFRHEALESIEGIEPAALQKLYDHSWPGNVRELRNVIHCACVQATSSRITIDCLPTFSTESIAATFDGGQLADAERQMILASLKRNRNNKTAAAAELGITPRTLSNKLKTYRLQGRDAA